MYYNYIKALHLIFVITWFAGLFYIPRLFIYHIEALKKTKTEANILIPQLKLMAKRLWYIITWPSAIDWHANNTAPGVITGERTDVYTFVCRTASSLLGTYAEDFII